MTTDSTLPENPPLAYAVGYVLGMTQISLGEAATPVHRTVAELWDLVDRFVPPHILSRTNVDWSEPR